MSKWQAIETAPQDGKEIEVAQLVEGQIVKKQITFWFEGDLTAGWANVYSRPLGFEPTHWRHVP